MKNENEIENNKIYNRANYKLLIAIIVLIIVFSLFFLIKSKNNEIMNEKTLEDKIINVYNSFAPLADCEFSEYSSETEIYQCVNAKKLSVLNNKKYWEKIIELCESDEKYTELGKSAKKVLSSIQHLENSPNGEKLIDSLETLLRVKAHLEEKLEFSKKLKIEFPNA